MRLRVPLRGWVLGLLLTLVSALAHAAPVASGSGATGAYEATLPADLSTTADLCSRVPCAEVLPQATQFSHRMGQPPYVEGYAGEGAVRRRVGFVMLSTDITDIPAYSGKPVVTLIGMDEQGRYTGAKVLKHSEPILLLGIPESALIRFNAQYTGHSVTQSIEVGPSRPEDGIVGVDAISGATVTVIAQNQVMQAAGTAVARQVGLIAPTVREPARYRGAVAMTGAARPSTLPTDWQRLVQSGAVQRLVVQPPQVGLPAGGTPFIELWFGSLNSPWLGPTLLGEGAWRNLMSRLGPQDNAVFVIRTAGAESFKGSGFVRGGLYDRVQVRQGQDTFTFRDLDYLNLYGLAVPGAPAATESAIFLIRSGSFSAAYPWKLNFLGNRVDRATGARTFANFDAEYWLPEVYLEGGRPKVSKPDPAWLKVWKSRATSIGLFVAWLLALAGVYAARERLTRRSTHRNKWPVNGFKYSFWAVSIAWVGWGLLAQPSITQVLTWFHALLFQWEWTLFLSDPFIFLFWIFIITTTFVWGRGLFCGWACPFGSLQELIHKVVGALGGARLQRLLPRVWHDRLKSVKYIVFLGLLAVSMLSMGLAEMLAEIEPFKTTFLVGLHHRAWPYGLFVVALLGLAAVIERPFCKYLCPLGAALALPSTFRWFGLRRKPDCNRCKACAVGCGAQAIDENGRIDHRECLHCLDCMVLYTDVQGCPPLAKERKQREREGLPLTAVGRDGYFIPIHPVAASTGDMASWDDRLRERLRGGTDPRCPTEPTDGPHPGGPSQPAWWWAELMDHLVPWTRQAWAHHRGVQVFGALVALSVSLAWVGVAAGRIPAKGIIVGWFAWSVLEALIRWQGKRRVKDGPWWGHRYRVANGLDMLSYVGFKNLLIGAMLFLLLKAWGGLAV